MYMFFFNNRNKIKINNIKSLCASHVLLKKKKMSLLLIKFKEISLTQFKG